MRGLKTLRIKDYEIQRTAIRRNRQAGNSQAARLARTKWPAKSNQSNET
jgi:hypothetical protein